MTDQSNFDDVGDFHAKFDLPSVTHQGPYPRHPDTDLRMFRMVFLLEELQEYLEAQGVELQPWPDGGFNFKIVDQEKFRHPDHAKMFDSLLDLAYVTFGAAHVHGYPWQEGWERVQAANITKERATSAEQSDRGGLWDVIKPPGWTPPDIEGLLRERGWDIPE